MSADTQQHAVQGGLRRVVRTVALLNLFYFGVEFAVALTIGSVALFADSVDFLEDTSVNLLIAFALGWSPRNRARLGMVLAGILLVPGLATLWTAWENSMPRWHRTRQHFPSRVSVRSRSICPVP